MGKLDQVLVADSNLDSQVRNLSRLMSSISHEIETMRQNLASVTSMLSLDEIDYTESIIHPTDQFLIIKRFVEKWQTFNSMAALKVKSDLISRTVQTFLSDTDHYEDQLHQALVGIWRLQFMYNIEGNNFTQEIF